MYTARNLSLWNYCDLTALQPWYIWFFLELFNLFKWYQWMKSLIAPGSPNNFRFNLIHSNPNRLCPFRPFQHSQRLVPQSLYKVSQYFTESQKRRYSSVFHSVRMIFINSERLAFFLIYNFCFFFNHLPPIYNQIRLKQLYMLGGVCVLEWRQLECHMLHGVSCT